MFRQYYVGTFSAIQNLKVLWYFVNVHQLVTSTADIAKHMARSSLMPAEVVTAADIWIRLHHRCTVSRPN